MGLGISASMTTPADADGFRRCDGYGCYRVMCDQRGVCVRVGGYIDSAYVAPPISYAAPYYRPLRVCDKTGCHYVKQREPRPSAANPL
jgi:hypothetical protein